MSIGDLFFVLVLGMATTGVLVNLVILARELKNDRNPKNK